MIIHAWKQTCQFLKFVSDPQTRSGSANKRAGSLTTRLTEKASLISETEAEGAVNNQQFKSLHTQACTHTKKLLKMYF